MIEIAMLLVLESLKITHLFLEKMPAEQWAQVWKDHAESQKFWREFVTNVVSISGANKKA